MTIRTIGVIGAGQMGSGIAQVFALAGFKVRLLDVRPEQLEKALQAIDRGLERQIAKGRTSLEQREAALARIETSTNWSIFGDCDLVIEAATEDEDVKREVYRKLVPHLNPGALIATNTSSISITRLAAATDRPDKFIGMHFMNPVPAMQLVELIRGIATEDETFQAVRSLTL